MLRSCVFLVGSHRHVRYWRRAAPMFMAKTFISRTEFHDSLEVLQKEVAALNSAPDQAQRLDELENRLRALERKKR